MKLGRVMEMGKEKKTIEEMEEEIRLAERAKEKDEGLDLEALRSFALDALPPKVFFRKNRFIPDFVAAVLMERFTFRTLPTREIFVYDEKQGIYKDAENFLREKIHMILKEETMNTRVEEVIGAVERLSYFEEMPPRNLIPLANGIFDVDKHELRPFSPDYFFKTKLAVAYDASAECVAFKEFLSQVLATDEDRETVREIFAYCVWRGHEIQKAFMFVGSGCNGKSTLLRVLTAFLGKENVSARSLQDLSANRFAASDLFGKYANICPDIPSEKITNTSVFKALTGGDLLTMEKKFREAMVFSNTAKLLFSANRVPITLDESDAFFRRWCIINFPFSFAENADPFLVEKLTVPSELSGIFNWAITSLTELLLRGEFSNARPVEELRELYVRKSDTVGAFANDCLEAEPDGLLTKEEMYRAYVLYCNEKLKTAPSSKNVFSRELARNAPYVSSTVVSVEGVRTPCWRGAKLKVS